MQPLYSNAIQGCVVEDNNCICIECEPFESQQGVVRLHHHITRFILVGKHTAAQAASQGTIDYHQHKHYHVNAHSQLVSVMRNMLLSMDTQSVCMSKGGNQQQPRYADILLSRSTSWAATDLADAECLPAVCTDMNI